VGKHKYVRQGTSAAAGSHWRFRRTGQLDSWRSDSSRFEVILARGWSRKGRSAPPRAHGGIWRRGICLPYPRHDRLITSGMRRFLLPILVASTTDDLGRIAYVIAAYNAGCCPPRCWGYWQSAISCSAPASSAGSYRCPSVWALSRRLRLSACGLPSR
jgi:hypothetical protein